MGSNLVFRKIGQQATVCDFLAFPTVCKVGGWCHISNYLFLSFCLNTPNIYIQQNFNIEVKKNDALISNGDVCQGRVWLYAMSTLLTL